MLLSMADTLWPYFHGYKGGLERLRSVAEAFDDYIELKYLCLGDILK